MNRISLVGRLRTPEAAGEDRPHPAGLLPAHGGGLLPLCPGRDGVPLPRGQGMEGTMSMLQRTSTSLTGPLQALGVQIQTFWKDDDVSSLLVAPKSRISPGPSGATSRLETSSSFQKVWI